MRVLHIANDYPYTKVHSELYQSLDKHGVEQVIFTPLRDNSLVGANRFESAKADFLYAPIINKLDRLRYYYKIKKTAIYIEQNIDISTIDCIHASTLFSDGGVAYQLFIKYNIPYIVAVRSADVNDFLHIAVHTWKYAKKILENAERIIFITEVILNKFKSHPYIKSILHSIEKKFELHPNGISDYWINNINPFNQSIPYSILYVGSFLKRKNVDKLIESILFLKKQYPHIKLTLVGKGGALESYVKESCEKYPKIINYIGSIKDINKLCTIYRENSIFVLPSIHETFGLVYFEALSQNMAIVYTKNDGVDGLLTSKSGEKLLKISRGELASKISIILENRDKYSNSDINFNHYSWAKIAGDYLNMYNTIINQK